MTGPTGLLPEQVDALLAPLHRGRVKTLSGNSHLEAWDIRRHLLRVFGWGGWDFEVVSCDCILDRSAWSEVPTETGKGRHWVAYRVIGRLTIKDQHGTVLARFEDGATGDAQNQPSFGDAHDMAIKTAMSQALKRCAVNLGDRFGLSLYNGGGTAAVVGASVAHPAGTSQHADEDVTGGELPSSKPPAADTAGEGAQGQEVPQQPPDLAADPLTLMENSGLVQRASSIGKRAGAKK